jgi:hypothetical protein
VVKHYLSYDAQAAGIGFSQEKPEIPYRPVYGLNIGVVGNIVAIVFERRRVEREKPDGSNPQVLKIIELLGYTRKITDTISITVAESTGMKLVDDGILVPEGVTILPEIFVGSG